MQNSNQGSNKSFMDFLYETNNTKTDEALEKKRWKLMIVDDDLEVHIITRIVLKDFVYENCRLELLSAYSEKEARALIDNNPDIAVILLDVVMEEEDSGLKLIKYIRNDLKNDEVRIILRTGQPGQAPEKKVIYDYDINDYKEKTELTSQKLYTSIVLSLRAYESIRTAKINKQGLERVINATKKLFQISSKAKLSSIVLEQIKYIFGGDCKEQNYNQSIFIAFKDKDEFYIMAGNGRFFEHIGNKVKDVLSSSQYSIIEQMISEGKLLFEGENIAIHFSKSTEIECIIYIDGIVEHIGIDHSLMEIFCNSIASSYENLSLSSKLHDTQKEIIFTLGEMSEARSKDTGFHVKRVAELCKLIAIKYGMDEDEAEVVSLASAMHDIGKLGIPGHILNKPGKLTEEEFEIMKTHTLIGYEMLKDSDKEIIKIASIIAYTHHEKYDGTGYPNGVKGDNIHIYGRITAVADVFDALSTVRVYKPAWETDKVLEYFKQQRGKHFDPEIVDVLFKNINEILDIYKKLKGAI
jgi:response regulator RpfG family c-di-GMP phosphodiesterase